MIETVNEQSGRDESDTLSDELNLDWKRVFKKNKTSLLMADKFSNKNLCL